MGPERSLLRAIAVAIAMTLCAPAARADDAGADDVASATFKQALEAYDTGRYAEAGALFERAYLHRRMPALLFNIAQASRMLGDCARAVAYYRRFIADAPDSADRPRADAWIADLGGCAGSPPKPVMIRALAPPPPAAAPPPVPIDRAPVARVPAPAPSTLPAVLLLAGGAALGGAGVVSALRADEASQRTSQLFMRGGTWDDAAAATERDGRRAQAWSIVLVSAAIVAAAAGVAVFLRSGHAARGER